MAKIHSKQIQKVAKIHSKQMQKVAKILTIFQFYDNIIPNGGEWYGQIV